MTNEPKTIDEYLVALDEERRNVLERLRKTIREVAPDAEECISYRLPAFRQKRMLVGFGATGRQCAFYLMSSTVLESFKDELKDYDTGKGTIRFHPDHPLPDGFLIFPRADSQHLRLAAP